MTNEKKPVSMTLMLLEQLVAWNGVHMGGDVDEDLRNVGTAGFKRTEGQFLTTVIGATALTARAYGIVRAFYDLGLIEALHDESEGSVHVHGDRAKQLLHLVELWHAGAEVMVAKVTREKAKPIVLPEDDDEH